MKKMKKLVIFIVCSFGVLLSLVLIESIVVFFNPTKFSHFSMRVLNYSYFQEELPDGTPVQVENNGKGKYLFRKGRECNRFISYNCIESTYHLPADLPDLPPDYEYILRKHEKRVVENNLVGRDRTALREEINELEEELREELEKLRQEARDLDRERFWH